MASFISEPRELLHAFTTQRITQAALPPTLPSLLCQSLLQSDLNASPMGMFPETTPMSYSPRLGTSLFCVLHHPGLAPSRPASHCNLPDTPSGSLGVPQGQGPSLSPCVYNAEDSTPKVGIEWMDGEQIPFSISSKPVIQFTHISHKFTFIKNLKSTTI